MTAVQKSPWFIGCSYLLNRLMGQSEVKSCEGTAGARRAARAGEAFFFLCSQKRSAGEIFGAGFWVRSHGVGCVVVLWRDGAEALAASVPGGQQCNRQLALSSEVRRSERRRRYCAAAPVAPTRGGRRAEGSATRRGRRGYSSAGARHSPAPGSLSYRHRLRPSWWRLYFLQVPLSARSGGLAACNRPPSRRLGDAHCRALPIGWVVVLGREVRRRAALARGEWKARRCLQRGAGWVLRGVGIRAEARGASARLGAEAEWGRVGAAGGVVLSD